MTNNNSSSCLMSTLDVDVLPARKTNRLKLFAPRRGRTPEQHGVYEDILAVLSGALFISFGLVIYAHALLLAGGIAGFAVIVQRATGVEFGWIFFLSNLPFYILAVSRMGWSFATRSLAAVALVSVLTRLTESWIGFSLVEPIYGAVIGGLLMAMGLLMLFRHRTGLSGLTILALYLEEHFGINAGLFQLLTDLAIFVLAAVYLPMDRLLLSVVGAVVMNVFLAINHKPGRYLGLT